MILIGVRETQLTVLFHEVALDSGPLRCYCDFLQLRGESKRRIKVNEKNEKQQLMHGIFRTVNLVFLREQSKKSFILL